MIVHLVRHGEVRNPSNILYGRLPGFELSARGRAQAEAATSFLARRPIGFIAVSPLRRALQTAQPLADALGLDPVPDDRLIEAGSLHEGEDFVQWKHVARYYSSPFRPRWGEAYGDIAHRVLDAARAAGAAAHASGEGLEAVCVTHQLPIVCARRRAEGKWLLDRPLHRRCALASVTSLTFDGGWVRRIDYAEPAALIGGHFHADGKNIR